MKKIYTLLSFLLLGYGAVGQSTTDTTITERTTVKKTALDRAISAGSVASLSTSRIDIYTEDFDGGIPEDWTVVTETGPCSWEWTDEGHQGEYPSAPLASTTADNGWLILDSDNCGTTEGGIEISHITSPSIDLSAYDAVSVRFEQYFRRYGPAAEVTSLEVSIDGGNEWTSYVFNADVEQAGTSNPDIAQVNLSNLVGGESDVQFRLRWEGTWGYGWQVDDFKVIVPEENDLTLSGTDYQQEFIYADSENFRDLVYSIYPTSQIRELDFRGKVTNNGGVTQTNVQLQVNITGPNDYDVTLTSTATDIVPADTAWFFINDYMPESEVGEYTVTFTAIQDVADDNPEDNTRSTSFAISEAEFARDRYTREGEFTNYDDYYKIGSWFYMENEEDVYCIGAALSATSVPGTFYSMQLLNSETTFMDMFIAETGYVTVPPQEYLNEAGDAIFTYVWMTEEQNPVPLPEGDIFVALNHDGGPDAVNVGLSGNSAPQTSLMWEGSEGVDGTWYYITSTPMIRLGLSQEFCDNAIDETISIETVEQVDVFQLYPNPTGGQISVEYTLLQASDVQLMFFDINGKIVLNENLGAQTTGEYRYNFDFSDQAAGIYTLVLNMDGKSFTKQVVIK